MELDTASSGFLLIVLRHLKEDTCITIIYLIMVDEAI